MSENIKNILLNDQELDLVKVCLKLELISMTDDEDWTINNKEKVEYLNNLIKKLNEI